MSIKSKWIDAVYTIATGSIKFRNLLTPTGAVIYGIFTALFVIAGRQIDIFLRLPKLFKAPLNMILAIPLLIAALMLIGWSVFYFLRAEGTPVPFNPPPQLVTGGPYAFSRNPMLTGVFLLLFGLGIWMGSICVVFVFTPLFIAFNVWELKAIEEPELARRLGRDYTEYKKKTPMFLPGFGIKVERKK